MTERPFMEEIHGGYRCTYGDETALEAVDIERDRHHQLFATVTAWHQGRCLHRARFPLLNQRDQQAFHKGAASLNGYIQWRARLQAMITGMIDREKLADEELPHGCVQTITVEPFPVDVLPAPMRQLVQEGAAALPCPPDFIAVPMLSAAGAAIGNSRALEIKPGWIEGPRIYSAIVADPGSKKSPAAELAMAPTYATQRQCATA
jgi:Protein of unknown function (DUF3987)